MDTKTEGLEEKQKELTNSRPHHTKRAVQSLIFTWPELRAGDCQQDGGEVVLRSDGTATFTCTTITYHTHSGDTWGCAFAALDGGGNAIFGSPYIASPRMDDGDPPPKYNWSATFTFPAQLFGNVASMNQRYSC